SFSYVPNDQYKPTQKIVETLVKIISRGGNYLLNIAPGPNGDFDQAAYDRLEELSSWVTVNESAIYATRAIAPYHEGDYYYTRSKDYKTVNVFHLMDEKDYEQPAKFEFTIPENFNVKEVKLLGYKGKIKWTKNNDKLTIVTPKMDTKYASVIQLTSK